MTSCSGKISTNTFINLLSNTWNTFINFYPFYYLKTLYVHMPLLQMLNPKYKIMSEISCKNVSAEFGGWVACILLGLSKTHVEALSVDGKHILKKSKVMNEPRLTPTFPGAPTAGSSAAVCFSVALSPKTALSFFSGCAKSEVKGGAGGARAPRLM